MMFSATFPKAARELAHEYLEDGAIKIKVGRAGSTHRNIEQHVRMSFKISAATSDDLPDLLCHCRKET